jgi:ABC-type glutathione transport system ATPase component
MHDREAARRPRPAHCVPSAARRWCTAASFSIAPGEKLALVGESGSGKTVTALSLLQLAQNARLSGSALLAGRDGEPALDLVRRRSAGCCRSVARTSP